MGPIHLTDNIALGSLGACSSPKGRAGWREARTCSGFFVDLRASTGLGGEVSPHQQRMSSWLLQRLVRRVLSHAHIYRDLKVGFTGAVLPAPMGPCPALCLTLRTAVPGKSTICWLAHLEGCLILPLLGSSWQSTCLVCVMPGFHPQHCKLKKLKVL